MATKTLLEQGRESFTRRDWDDAYQSLESASHAAPLGIKDLTRLAWTAGLTGRDEEMLAAQERRYHACVEAGDETQAADAAFWLGFRLFSMGESGRATAWLARAERIVERLNGECVVRGYLLLPQVHRRMANLDFDGAAQLASNAAEIGEQYRDSDLTALARNFHGRALLRSGDTAKGLALLDEAMLEVTTHELSPIVAGMIYCNVIAGCQQVHALERSREWTAALAAWCDTQPQLVQFTGTCQVHRAEILQFGGAWSDSENEARRATAWCDGPAFTRDAGANGFYQLAEIHRLRGEFDDAEKAYRRAGDLGREPQPGLALLRLAQGQPELAANSIRRVMGSTHDRLQRLALLAPFVEIMLSVDAFAEAREGCRELDESAARIATEALAATAVQAHGTTLLAAGDAQAAVAPLMQALRKWQSLDAPYQAARVRMQLARACLQVADRDAAQMHLRAARGEFEKLGAQPDLKTIDAIETASQAQKANHTLSARELEVLQLVAQGKTNKAIARELSLSEKTVDRHVSNIFSKLNVASRAGATAYAYENKLLRPGFADN